MAQLGTATAASAARGPLFYVGAGSLLLATTIETLAVIGRHLGVPFIGALELMQACILLLACAAMLAATLTHSHASVTLLVSRLSARGQRVLHVFSCLLSALFFIAIAAGSVWVLVETWYDQEASELLRVPFRPLRIISVLAAVAIVIAFLRDLSRAPRIES
jgi:TRAP-type C4-dicarboxylate transport system permease small subunit